MSQCQYPGKVRADPVNGKFSGRIGVGASWRSVMGAMFDSSRANISNASSTDHQHFRQSITFSDLGVHRPTSIDHEFWCASHSPGHILQSNTHILQIIVSASSHFRYPAYSSQHTPPHGRKLRESTLVGCMQIVTERFVRCAVRRIRENWWQSIVCVISLVSNQRG